MKANVGKLEQMLSLCLGIKSKESLHICYQQERKEEATEIIKAGRSISSKVFYSEILGTRIPKGVRERILSSDITVFCVNEDATEQLGHSEERESACALGRRVAFLLDQLYVPCEKDIKEIEKRAVSTAEILSRSKKLTLITASGELEIVLSSDMQRRKPFIITCMLRKPGSWGAIPDYAEVGIAPLEGKARGTVNVGIGITGLGRIREPLLLEFEEGRLVGATGEKSTKVLEFVRSYKNLDVLCEVAIGMSHIETRSEWLFSEKKRLGYVHLGMGSNTRIGGMNDSERHLDFIVGRAEIKVDSGKTSLFKKN